MPELPEVEVTRLSLAPHLEGAQVQQVWMGKPLRWPLGQDPARLQGLTVGAIQRRGKYLWLPLQLHHPSSAEVRRGSVRSKPSDAQGGLLIHLGMSGSLGLSDGRQPRGPHDHFEMKTDRGTLRLTDPRRFGAVVWSSALDAGMAAKLLKGLGLEPFDPQLTPAWFHEQLHKRRAPIKQVLLAGDVVVGAGNIYACEALFESGIDPRTSALKLSRPRTARLLQAVQHTLARALELGGTTLRDFKDAHGMSGEFQHQAQVYDREAQPCSSCGTKIRRVLMGQRSTYFCPKCQRR